MGSKAKSLESGTVFDDMVDAFFEDMPAAEDGPPGLASDDGSLEDVLKKLYGGVSSLDNYGVLDDEVDDQAYVNFTRQIVSDMIGQLDNAAYVHWVCYFCVWGKLAAQLPGGAIPCGSGCSGSGMDHIVLQAIADEVTERSSVRVRFRSALVCEMDKDKRSGFATSTIPCAARLTCVSWPVPRMHPRCCSPSLMVCLARTCQASTT